MAGNSWRRYANAYALWIFCRRSLFLTNHREHRGTRGRSHAEDFTGDRSF
ncbi:hypothetical protein GTQ43_27020 [Nostoc sp. KVJ3]|nr:hypothetical protein [Nostoc sp. KVJ3]MCW5317323.1 hypothetical protein [Nostoc sp. KVJ3]